MLSVIMLNVTYKLFVLSIFMLSVVRLSVVRPNVAMLSVVAPECYLFASISSLVLYLWVGPGVYP
jgi:hypothetical protein